MASPGRGRRAGASSSSADAGRRGVRPRSPELSTRSETLLFALGRKLARNFPDWTLIVSPLPPEMMRTLSEEECALTLLCPRMDWFAYVLDGWESVRDA
jgi:hypothetical protein